MDTRASLYIAFFIIAFMIADFAIEDWDPVFFLTKKFLDFLEWVSIWR